MYTKWLFHFLQLLLFYKILFNTCIPKNSENHKKSTLVFSYPSKHARSGQCWPSVGRVGKTSANLPTLCQCCQCFANIFAKAVIIVVVSFLEFFSQLFNDSGPFSFTYRYLICQKYFFFIAIQPTLVEYWLNIGCQHRHYAFQPIQGQRWMPAPGQHWWIKFFLTTDNFL